jgi:pimeloyl-ACP methyl ester carboxylesterase
VTAAPTVVFIHGAWVHPSAWTPWVELFRDEGYVASAPGWPGMPDTADEARAHPEAGARQGIEDVSRHYTGIIDGLPGKPILIGHSIGALIAQKLLSRQLAAAAVAIDPVQFRGVLPLPLSTVRSVMPVLRNPANVRRTVPLTAGQFRYAFGNAVSAEESDELYRRWAVPAPGKPLFEAATANLNPRTAAAVDTANGERGPLLLISGGKDHTIPPAIVRAEYKKYRRSAAVTELREFPDRGHSLTMDRGWRAVADTALAWLAGQGLAPGGARAGAIPAQREMSEESARAASTEGRPPQA